METVPKKFVPFTHEDLAFKNELIKFARDLAAKQGFENGLASALIYSSFAEYIAENLLANLKHFVYQGTYNQYAGIIFIDERDETRKKTLGQNTNDLERFNFPDKSAILGCLKKITQARNNIFHNFAKSDVQGLQKIVLVDIAIIKTETEELFSKVNTVYAGLSKILIQPPASTQPNPQSTNSTSSPA